MAGQLQRARVQPATAPRPFPSQSLPQVLAKHSDMDCARGRTKQGLLTAGHRVLPVGRLCAGWSSLRHPQLSRHASSHSTPPPACDVGSSARKDLLRMSLVDRFPLRPRARDPVLLCSLRVRNAARRRASPLELCSRIRLLLAGQRKLLARKEK
eukprot:751382-Hanusia_phi.AAC.5